MNDGEHYREHGCPLARGVFARAEVEEMRGAIDGILRVVEGSEHDDNHVRSSEAERDALAASIHLDGADEENGCMCVVPGTHVVDPLEMHGPSNTVDAEELPLERGTPLPARAGDVVFLGYLTVHGSGPNRSGRTRHYRERRTRFEVRAA
jgi:ectoine hydroxylase-related dioxygenase (phytanoyl-CoA dioxygenase family)